MHKCFCAKTNKDQITLHKHSVNINAETFFCKFEIDQIELTKATSQYFSLCV